MKRLALTVVTALLGMASLTTRAEDRSFDGRPWNVASGNASTYYIQHSPIGAAPSKDFAEAPPNAAWLTRMKVAACSSSKPTTSTSPCSTSSTLTYKPGADHHDRRR